MRWGDVDGSQATIRGSLSEVDGGGVVVQKPKNKRTRTVALSGDVVVMLKERRAFLAKNKLWPSPDDFVFADPAGEIPRPDSLTHAFARFAKEAGVDAHLHHLRHVAASEALKAGVPLIVVSRALGHRGIEITANVYGHIVPADQDQVAAALDAAYVGP